MNYSRKKSPSQGGSNYSNNGGGRNNNKPRFSGGGQNNNNNGNRPRKNYGAMREKYLTQARDALSAGDRVLAENYFQHADHCFRMIAEENASRPQRVHTPLEQQVAESSMETTTENTEGDDSISTNVTSLPAFLTASYEAPKKEDEPAVQSWEDRDEV